MGAISRRRRAPKSRQSALFTGTIGSSSILLVDFICYRVAARGIMTSFDAATIFIPKTARRGFLNPDHELLLLWIVTLPDLDGLFPRNLRSAPACRESSTGLSGSCGAVVAPPSPSILITSTPPSVVNVGCPGRK
jgi:hypothetical protein